MERTDMSRINNGGQQSSHRLCHNLCGTIGLAFIAGLAGGASMGFVSVEIRNTLQPLRLYNFKQLNNFIADIPSLFSLCLFISLLSLLLGVLVGSVVYKLVIRKKGPGAREEALAYAAPVAVIGTTIIGAILPLISEQQILHNNFCHLTIALLIIQHSSACGIIIQQLFHSPGNRLMDFLSSPTQWIRRNLVNMHALPYIFIVFVFFVLLIAGVFRFQKYKELIFFSVLLVHMCEACFGVVLFCSLTDGIGKAYLSTVATGVVMEVLVLGFPVLGPVGTLGALLGVSGSAGVALYAAGAVGERYGGAVGRVTAALGAAAGVFLPVTSQDVSFSIPLALFAAGISGTPFVIVKKLQNLYGAMVQWYRARDHTT